MEKKLLKIGKQIDKIANEYAKSLGFDSISDLYEYNIKHDILDEVCNGIMEAQGGIWTAFVKYCYK